MPVLTTQLEVQVNEFISKLKRRQVIGSYEVAKETAVILRQVVSTTRWHDIDALIADIKALGRKLSDAQPKELAVGNIVRRVLKVIREVASGELAMDDMDDHDFDDHTDDDNEDSGVPPIKNDHITSPLRSEHSPVVMQSSMFRLLADEPRSNAEEKSTYKLKPLIIQEINEEIVADLESVYKGIADQATDYIHANEVIMTIGRSRTVEEFLLRAAQKRKFQVIVAETAPTYQGHEMAAILSKAGIDVTVIADSAIFAAMPRVNKVVLGAHAVLANGGLISVTGSHLLAAAAKHHSTPVLVCTALYKLSPLFAYDADTFNIPVAPNTVLDFQSGALIDSVSVSNPYYDYVQPESVSLFIHNLGSAPPTYVYRLINDNYDPEDTEL